MKINYSTFHVFPVCYIGLFVTTIMRTSNPKFNLRCSSNLLTVSCSVSITRVFLILEFIAVSAFHGFHSLCFHQPQQASGYVITHKKGRDIGAMNWWPKDVICLGKCNSSCLPATVILHIFLGLESETASTSC